MQAVKFWLIYKKDKEMDWYIPICIKLHQFQLFIKQNKVRIIKDFNFTILQMQCTLTD